MENQQLIEYIKTEMAKGISVDVIRVNLKMGGGWSDSDIAGAMQVIQQTLSANRKPIQPGPSITPSSIPVVPVVNQAQVTPVTDSTSGQNSMKNIITPQVSNVVAGVGGDMSSNKKKLILILGVSLAGFLLIVGIVYSLLNKSGLFVKGQYSESNFFTSILEQSSKITSSKYKFVTSLNIEPRESDAKPFEVKISNDATLREQYQADSTRMKNATILVTALGYAKPYPATLQAALNSYNARFNNNHYKQDISIILDPETKKPYVYKQTDSGNNFELKINFTTTNAINTIRREWKYAATTTPIEDKTVTFTKDSLMYTYLPTEPPEPFLVTLGKQASYLPVEFSFEAGFSAAADWKSQNADWTANVSGNGDFGDLSYKVNIDILKKQEDYFLKINNIPSLFLFDLSNLKGQWIRISSQEKPKSETRSYDMVSSLTSQVPEFEKSYKETKGEFLQLIKKAAQFADDEKLIKFKNKPSTETVDGKKVTRYDLTLRKESILPFYKKVYEEVNNGNYKNIQLFSDSGLVEYLQSEEFNQVYDYYNSNTSISLFVDDQGFPVEIRNTFRLIPPDTATQFKDKQAKLVSTILISDINVPVKISVPSDVKDIDSITSEIQKNNNIATGDITIKTSFANIRAYAELYNDKHGNYGSSSAKGNCTVANTVFSDSSIADYIADIENIYGSAVSKVSATCYNTTSSWAMSMPLINSKGTDGFWCADSTGYNNTISKKISKSSCK